MEDLMEVCAMRDDVRNTLQNMSKNFLAHLTEILNGNADAPAVETEPYLADGVTPQQIMKRIKRLSKVRETEEAESPCVTQESERSKRQSNRSLLAKADAIEEEAVLNMSVEVAPASTESNVTVAIPEAPTEEVMDQRSMPPPPEDTSSLARPMRQLRIKTEKNFKEPKLNSKLRRPANPDSNSSSLSVDVKLEHETRQSQHNANVTKQSSHSSMALESSVVLLPTSVPVIFDLVSDGEEQNNEEPMTQTENKAPEPEAEPEPEPVRKSQSEKQLRVVIKREKSSLDMGKVAAAKKSLEKANSTESTNETQATTNSTIQVENSTTTTTVSTANPKKKEGKKKKHRPIKVERFSDIDKPPVAVGPAVEQAQVERTPSVYEDAREDVPQVQTRADETVTITAKTPSDATFCTNNDATDGVHQANATLKAGQNGDATFNLPASEIQRTSLASSHHSMATAKDAVSPNSLITDDETENEADFPANTIQNVKANVAQKPSKVVANKLPKSIARNNELFNPLVQSPVKMKVKAFENVRKVAIENDTAKITRSKFAKENIPTVMVSSHTTPLAGKLQTMTLSRFLTPTQTSNITPSSNHSSMQVKKLPYSASKAMTLPKSSSVKVKMPNSTKATGLSRENSAEEMRKQTEERKKQREQKHMLAAQQREAKERERNERLAKFAKEREEKLLAKKQYEMELRKQEEMQRKHAEAEAKKKAAKLKAIAEQEREMLQQINTPSVKGRNVMAPPPPPKSQSQQKYTFEMLHEDDSTDDEEKISYKRPPVPTWSRRETRVSTILMQQHFPTSVIDHFFSVKPRTLDLSEIFVNIDKRHLKRNSSAMWSTPPRYSELPKY